MTYSEATNWLFQQFPSYQLMGSKAFKPTLDNTYAILALFDNPHERLSFVHVAGSNGKGSVCSMVASSLTEAGFQIGLFTSPHIQDFTERIRVNGVCISEEDVVDFVDRIQKADLSFEPSFFEMTFALSLVHFERSKCDLCVIETGLGGRLDATNVISPILSIVTGISLEHTDMLGDTLEKIAAEKAGIIKKNIPVILGKGCEPVRSVFEEAVTAQTTHILPLSNTPLPDDFPLLGKYQHDNFETASTVLNYLDMIGFESDFAIRMNAVKNITGNTGYRGRLQVVEDSPRVIADVSHNPGGMQATIAALSKKIASGSLHIVYGTSSDKDIPSVVACFPESTSLYLTEFQNPRSASKEQLENAALQFKFDSVHSFSTVSEAVREAKKHAVGDDTILITGSFFLLSDFF